MSQRQTQTDYHLLSIVLHWVLGLSLVATFVLGVYMHELPFSPTRLKLYNWHKWAGVSILMLSVLRLVWRMTHPPAPLPAAVQKNMPGWQMRAYRATHGLFYVLFLVVPLIGWAYSSAAGFPVVLFGVLPLPDLLAADKELAELIKPLHKASALMLAALVLVHVGAAIKHHFVDRDGLMARMVPWLR